MAVMAEVHCCSSSFAILTRRRPIFRSFSSRVFCQHSEMLCNVAHYLCTPSRFICKRIRDAALSIFFYLP